MALRLRRWLACLMLSGLGVSGTGWLAMCQAAEPDTAPKPAWDVNHPPGEALVVPIDTRTGTWMSVDVSPDGQRILFDLLGVEAVKVVDGTPSACDKRGEVEVSVKDSIAFYERNRLKVREELETLARNEAPGLGADPAAILAHCKDRLPPYMVPHSIHVRDAIPRNPNGKFDRPLLQTIYSDKESA